jgi:uncharacterized protein (DUF885 family)
MRTQHQYDSTMTHRCFLTSALFLSCLLAQSAETPFEQNVAQLASRLGNDTERLHDLFKLDWEHAMVENPEFATAVGYPGQNDRWTDNSLEAIERRRRESPVLMKAILTIDRSKLSAADQLNYDLFRKNQEDSIEGARFKQELLPINQMGGVQQEVAETLEMSPRVTVADYENILKRLEGAPVLIDQTIVLLEKGLEAKVTPPRITLRDVPQQIKNQMEENPEKSALLRPFQEFPADIQTADRERLRKAAATVLKEKVVPAYAKLHEFFVKKYLPNTRETIAITDLPDGKAWYAHNVRTTTTTSLTPQQIHELGLSEVKRIREEMDKIIKETKFKGSFADFSKYLRTDPKFFYKDADSLLTGYRDITKRIDPELARLFGKLPRLPYGVRPVPAYAEKSQTTGYYQPGSPEAGRPGWYFANTYALDTRPKWEMEALTLHEAVPGHHLQIALSQEMEDAPEFRKHGDYTAFVEGWALYSESLGTEIGLYKDPYMKYGQLTYEIWRAIRLVVDTGMHSMGWTRQQAIDYFMANASKMEHDVTVEIDRYIVWPGQALGYKIGELKIKELRAYATKELGSKFDIRKFHDRILENGALPMDILEKRIKEWVEREKGLQAAR